MISIRNLLGTVLFLLAVDGQAGSRCWSVEQQSRTLGPVQVRVSLLPEDPVIGDLLVLDIEVTADPDVEVLMPEFGEALGRFQIVDFTPREKRGANGETVYSQKYKLQSPPSGKHFIPPVLIEFVDRRPGEQRAPEGMDAYELLTDRISFVVKSVVVDSATDGMQPPLGLMERSSAVDDFWYARRWTAVIVTVFVVLIVCLGLFGWHRRKRVVRRTAYQLAKRRLEQLVSRPLPKKADVDGFYVELTAIIRQYLENRFELRAPELTTEEFIQLVSGSGELISSHKSLLKEFLKHADLVKFAGMLPSSEDIKGSLQAAALFLEETRENSPMMVVPPSAGRASQSESQVDRLGPSSKTDSNLSPSVHGQDVQKKSLPPIPSQGEGKNE